MLRLHSTSLRNDARLISHIHLVDVSLGPFVLPYLANKDSFLWPMRHAAICLCDDLVEFASPSAHELLGAMIPAILDILSTATEPVLRQAAAYGAAICAQHGGDAVTPHIKSMVEVLVAAVTASGARDGELENATDNAISALVRFVMYRRGAPGVDSDAIMSGAVAYLPIKADGVEARSIHGLAVEAIAKSKFFVPLRFKTK